MYFRPDETLLERKIIMWTDPYRRYFDAFFDWNYCPPPEVREKLNFARYHIKGSYESYFEEPFINIIILNKEFDAAYVEYHDLDSGMEVWLIKRDGKWIITKSGTRYIS